MGREVQGIGRSGRGQEKDVVGRDHRTGKSPACRSPRPECVSCQLIESNDFSTVIRIKNAIGKRGLSGEVIREHPRDVWRVGGIGLGAEQKKPAGGRLIGVYGAWLVNREGVVMRSQDD